MKNSRLVASGAFAVVALLAAIVALGGGIPVRQHARLATGGDDLQSYPAEWATTLDVARQQVSFSVFVPATATTYEETASTTYVFPGGSAIAMDFPLVTASSSPVRQEYIEVWEGPWTMGVEPAKLFAEDIADDPTSKQVIVMDGINVLTVDAHSPSDDDRANPAFLRFELDGTDIQISGGDHLEDLLEIAKSLIAQASATA
jgi:hypothetical protein